MRNRSIPSSTSTGHTASTNTAAKTSVPSDTSGAAFLAANATAKWPMNTSIPLPEQRFLKAAGQDDLGAQPRAVEHKLVRTELESFVDFHARHLGGKRLRGE